jgi:hypothetical protein
LNHVQKYGDIIRFFWKKKCYFGDFSKTIEFATKKFHNNMKFHTQKNWLKWWHFKQTLTSNIVRFHIFYMDEDGEIINNPVRNMQGIDT